MVGVLLAGWVWGGFQPLIGLGIIGEPSVDSALVFPINKMLWTSTYVLYTAGLGFLSLAACLWLVDLAATRHRRRRAGRCRSSSSAPTRSSRTWHPGWLAKLLHVWTVTSARRHARLLWEWTQQHVFAPLIPSAPLASLVHSSVYALLWILICAWMYRRRVFLKL